MLKLWITRQWKSCSLFLLFLSLSTRRVFRWLFICSRLNGHGSHGLSGFICRCGAFSWCSNSCLLSTVLLNGLLRGLEGQLIYHLDSDLSKQVPIGFYQVLDHTMQTFLNSHVHLDCLSIWQYFLQVYCVVLRVGLDEALLQGFRLL